MAPKWMLIALQHVVQQYIFKSLDLISILRDRKKVMKPNHHELLGVGNDLDVNMDDVNLKMEGCER
jgi:hypothetical protein